MAEGRRTEARKLAQLVRGDLDWVVMKALEKDRTRRYATANELAQDIKRYLNEEPVEARPPSAAYRVRKRLAKWSRRNRPLVASSTAVAVVAIIAAGGSCLVPKSAATRNGAIGGRVPGSRTRLCSVERV